MCGAEGIVEDDCWHKLVAGKVQGTTLKNRTGGKVDGCCGQIPENG